MDEGLRGIPFQDSHGYKFSGAGGGAGGFVLGGRGTLLLLRVAFANPGILLCLVCAVGQNVIWASSGKACTWLLSVSTFSTIATLGFPSNFVEWSV